MVRQLRTSVRPVVWPPDKLRGLDIICGREDPDKTQQHLLWSMFDLNLQGKLAFAFLKLKIVLNSQFI